MITAENAVRTARSLIGTPYAQMDCIALIRAVIRRSPGGDTAYRCAGTNWLWKSALNAKKYRHLTWRQEGLEGARAGMLAFKRAGEDVHHVGLVTGEGTVIHASSVSGEVTETPLDGSWQLLAAHREIEAGGKREEQSPSPTGDADAYAGVVRSALPEDSRVGAGFYSALKANEHTYTSLLRSDGVSILLAGSWRVADD